MRLNMVPREHEEMLFFKTLTFEEAENEYDEIFVRDTGISNRIENAHNCTFDSVYPKRTDECLDTAGVTDDIISGQVDHRRSNSLTILDVLSSPVVLLGDNINDEVNCLRKVNDADQNDSNTIHVEGMKEVDSVCGKGQRYGTSQMFGQLPREQIASSVPSEQAKFHDVPCMDQLSLAILNAIGCYPNELDDELTPSVEDGDIGEGLLNQ